jgi:pimeloyl-ACP methyl ester carboxylesterase
MGKNTFILVHGAWHGGWCWNKVVPLLEKSGNTVFTPTLTDATPSTNLTTHISDIVQLIEKENLKEVILVGHSYAGSVISGVAEIKPEKIEKLIYLDAIVPENGKSTVDYLPSLPSYAKEISVSKERFAVLLPPLPEFFGIEDADDIAWMKNLLSPIALGCLTEKSRILNPVVDKIGKTYILCSIPLSQESGHAFLTAYNKFNSADMNCYKVNAPHDVMITHPAKLVNLLLK